MQKDPKIPANYQTVMPYLILNGAKEFIPFVENVFAAKLTYKVMRDEQTIMHAEIMIGDCTIMFADATPEFNKQTAGLFVYVDNADETFKKAIENGSATITEITDQPCGRSGGITDPFGNAWWITSINEA